MLNLVVKSYKLIMIVKSFLGILFIGILLTWTGLRLGLDRDTLQFVAIWGCVALISIMLILTLTKHFELNMNSLKSIVSILLVINLSQWSTKGFQVWVSSFSIITLLYLLLTVYKKYYNKLTFNIVSDKLKTINFEPLEDKEENEKRAILSIMDTFKPQYKDSVFAYKVDTTSNSVEGVKDITVDFAYESKNKQYKVFDVILSYEV
ncbi:TPA: hypothetical protein ACQ0F8_001808 [Streptococcus agalactiae]|nr:hypothetical protein [Streptococcus agalactiae]HEO4177373.1 hypothetical protein [Streptococcus agalactiae]